MACRPPVPAPRRRPAGAALLLALALTGCGQMAIDGELVDAGGKPLAGARVTAMGSTCATTSGDDGKFSLPCPTGTYDLLITKEGYIEVKEQLDATERERYNIGKKVMIAIPDSKGLFWFQDDVYQPLHPGFLTRDIQRTAEGKTRAYCLDQDASEANSLAAGVHAFFDNETDGWRPFRLDEAGCAYRDAQDERGRWTVSYKEKPDFEERTLEAGKKIAFIELTAGDYFIADWDNGFFTTAEGDKKHYTGFWLTVR